MKIILVLLDGLGDRSCGLLDDRTPLQAARTPNLDRLAGLGANGLYHAGLPGQCLPSETAHYLMFGYDLKDFPGRGLLEAVGYGVPFEDGDVLSLAHLAGVNVQRGIAVLIRGKGDIRGDEDAIKALYDAVGEYEADGIRFRLHRTRWNDGILVMSGGASPYISDCDPMLPGRPMARVLPLVNNPESGRAARTAKALNRYLRFCHNTLEGHSVNQKAVSRGMPAANFLATQRCGRRIAQEPFYRRWGLRGLMVASGGVFRGLALELGMDFRRVDASRNAREEMRQALEIALESQSHDFVHIHSKAPDEAAHGGDPREKQAVISELDRALDPLLPLVERREDLLVAVTADHSTPSVSGLIHSGEFVPLTIAGPTARRDKVSAFDEVSVAGGSLGSLRGKELMLYLLNGADRSSLAGHCLGPVPRPYAPDTYDPFRPGVR